MIVEDIPRNDLISHSSSDMSTISKPHENYLLIVVKTNEEVLNQSEALLECLCNSWAERIETFRKWILIGYANYKYHVINQLEMLLERQETLIAMVTKCSFITWLL